jgi:hypothetical protein
LSLRMSQLLKPCRVLIELLHCKTSYLMCRSSVVKEVPLTSCRGTSPLRLHILEFHSGYNCSQEEELQCLREGHRKIPCIWHICLLHCIVHRQGLVVGYACRSPVPFRYADCYGKDSVAHAISPDFQVEAVSHSEHTLYVIDKTSLVMACSTPGLPTKATFHRA